MTMKRKEFLKRCDQELKLLVPREGASAYAQENARMFNANVNDVRDALLEPARDLLEKGVAIDDLAACLEKTVAELAFWRGVLLKVHGTDFGEAATPSDCLLRYVLS